MDIQVSRETVNYELKVLQTLKVKIRCKHLEDPEVVKYLRKFQQPSKLLQGGWSLLLQ